MAQFLQNARIARSTSAATLLKLILHKNLCAGEFPSAGIAEAWALIFPAGNSCAAILPGGGKAG